MPRCVGRMSSAKEFHLTHRGLISEEMNSFKHELCTFKHELSRYCSYKATIFEVIEKVY